MFEFVGELYQRSIRVLNVAYRPQEKEFAKMAKITGLGMIAIGVIGALIHTIMKLING